MIFLKEFDLKEMNIIKDKIRNTREIASKVRVTWFIWE